MQTEPLANRETVGVRAVFLGQRINMRALEQTRRVAVSPFVTEAGSSGYAVLFRYGVAVLFGLNAVEEAAFIKDLGNFVVEPFETPETEECTVKIDKDGAEGVEPSHILMRGMEMGKIQILADILAKSAVLSYYEKRMADTFDRIEPIAAALQSGGPSGRNARELLRHIGLTLSIQRKMVGHVEIEEKPDVLWERPDMERLFVRLEDEYEIRERHDALRHKLDLVYKTAETLLGVLQERRTLHVEWYIVILIVIEIIISLSEMIFPLHS